LESVSRSFIMPKLQRLAIKLPLPLRGTLANREFTFIFGILESKKILDTLDVRPERQGSRDVQVVFSGPLELAPTTSAAYAMPQTGTVAYVNPSSAGYSRVVTSGGRVIYIPPGYTVTSSPR